MNDSGHYIISARTTKEENTRHKETPTTRQSLLLYTTPLFTLHSNHFMFNQISLLLLRHFMLSVKQKTNKTFAGFQPLPDKERG